MLSYDMMRPAGSGNFHKPRGSWKVKQIFDIRNVGGTDTEVLPIITDTDVYVQIEVTEPLLCSPLVLGNHANKAGFYGVSNLIVNMTLLSNANRAWRSALHSGDKTATIREIVESQLLFTFITPHPSDLLPSRNVVPYYEMIPFKTPGSLIFQPRAFHGEANANGAFVEPQTEKLQTNSIQLNGIPDRVIICVRKMPTTLRCKDTDSYATIVGATIPFNNQAGISSSASQQQLYNMSVKSGLNMSYEEFSGNVISVAGYLSDGHQSQIRKPYTGVGSNLYVTRTGAANTANPGCQYIATTGSI